MRAQPDWERTRVEDRSDTCGQKLKAPQKCLKNNIQCPLDIQTLDKAAALPIATATRVTDLRQYINSNLAYSNLKFLVLCTN